MIPSTAPESQHAKSSSTPGHALYVAQRIAEVRRIPLDEVRIDFVRFIMARTNLP
jgi:hypothetical protein